MGDEVADRLMKSVAAVEPLLDFSLPHVAGPRPIAQLQREVHVVPDLFTVKGLVWQRTEEPLGDEPWKQAGHGFSPLRLALPIIAGHHTNDTERSLCGSRVVLAAGDFLHPRKVDDSAVVQLDFQIALGLDLEVRTLLAEHLCEDRHDARDRAHATRLSFGEGEGLGQAMPRVFGIERFRDRAERVEPTITAELNSMRPLTLPRAAAEVFDQQEPEERAGSLDEPIVRDRVAFVLEKMLDLFGKPSDARRTRTWNCGSLRSDETQRGGH